MMAEHTPVPWDIFNGGRSTLLHIDTAAENPIGGGVAICSVPATKDGIGGANADFIVRAVNAHDDLVAALKACVDIFEIQPGRMMPVVVRRQRREDALVRARAALAKAGAS